mgnify:CR=1 FL=1
MQAAQVVLQAAGEYAVDDCRCPGGVALLSVKHFDSFQVARFAY